MSETFEVTLTHEGGYRFEVDFHDGSGTTLQMDEPEPLGEGFGPNAARVLAGAIGNCLSASLLFCLDKAKVEVAGLRTHVSGSMVRNERGRLRVGALKVRIEPDFSSAPPARIDRCLEIFEDFCVVTASVRSGLQVEVSVDTPAAHDQPLAEPGADLEHAGSPASPV
jgi:organic hydroperoxide reductase OsmC/OhrA